MSTQPTPPGQFQPPQGQYQGPGQFQGQPPAGYAAPQPKPRKPFYLRWWFIVIVVLALLAILGAALGGGDEPAATPTMTAAAEASPTQDKASQSAKDEESAEPTQEAVADGDYTVTIDGSKQTKDYEGEKALVVDYTFTNNSDKAQSFLVVISAKAFQNGVELESAMILDDDVYDIDNSMKDVKPGAKLKVQSAYLLEDDSDVTLEVSDSWSFDDKYLAEATIAVK